MLTSVAPTQCTIRSHSQGKAVPKLPTHSTHGPVVVAFDGQAHDYLFNAAEYARTHLATNVQVVCATESDPIALTGFAEVPVSLDVTREQAELQRARAKVAIREWSVDADWPLQVEIGPVATVVADYARQVDASIVVLGQGRHNPLDRALGAERTVMVASTSRVPLLAVHRDESITYAGGFSRIDSVVVGMDYSPASIRAARLAAELLMPGGLMTFVHVHPHPENGWLAWEAAYNVDLSHDEQRMRELMSSYANIHLEFVTLHGDPAPMLLGYASQQSADLIAVGTEQRSFINRMLIGSVARRVLRSASCHVLTAPAPRATILAEISDDRARVRESSDPGEWAAMLDAFTRDNAGRSVRVDTQRKHGTRQMQQRHTVFDGAVYEPETQRMQFMFGKIGAQHLTHSHAGTTRVALIADLNERDLALVVTHSDGELTLLFE